MRSRRSKTIGTLALALAAGLLVPGGLWLRGQLGPDLDPLDTAEALYARARVSPNARPWGQAAAALLDGARALPGDRRLASLAEQLLTSPATPNRDRLRSDLTRILERALDGRGADGPAVSRNLASVLATASDRTRLARAAALFSGMIKRHPGDPSAHLALGRCLLGLARLEEAEATTFKAVKLAQAINNVYAVQRAKNTLGRIYVARGQHARARRLFKHAILRQNRFQYHRTDGTHWGCAYQGLGELYSALGRAATASMDIKLDEGDHASLFAAALAHTNGGNTGLALAYVDRALGLRPLGRYKVLRGFLLLFHKNYAQAKRMFQQAREVTPAIPGPRAGLGHLGIIRKDYTSARSHLSASLGAWPLSRAGAARHPGYYRLVHRMTRMGMGWMAANQNQHQVAIQQFDRILAWLPDDLMGLLGKGNSLLGLGQVDRAQEVFSRVLKKHPDNRYALAELAVIRMSKGSDVEAERGFKKALEQDSQHYTCPYEGLGLLYLRQGKLAEAKKNLKKAIRINPNIEYKKFNALARIYLGEQRYDEAATLLRRSIKNFPHDPEAPLLLRRLQRLRRGKGPGPAAASTAPIPAAQTATARFTVVSLGLWMPVDLLVTASEGERFDYNHHEVEQSEGVVRVDGRPAGLDLAGLGAAEAARRLAATPRAAASVRVDPATLCDPRVLRALNSASSGGLSLTIPDATPPDTDLGCLVKLSASELFVHLDQAGDRALGALAALKNLRELKLGGRALSDAGLAHLARLAALQKLTLADTPISDEGLAHLARLTGLRELNLWGTQLTDAGLAHLAGLTALRKLELGDTAVSDRGLAHLAGLRRLTSLGLGATRVAGPGLVHLKSLGRLETLELWYTDLTDAGLVHLSGMARLQQLQIWYTRVTDAGLAHLARLGRLRHVGLGGTTVGDRGLAHLSRLERLHVLDLWGTRVTDAGLIHLRRLSELEDLNLGGTHISDAGLAHLAHLTRLRRLSLWGTAVTSAGMKHLQKLTGLEELELFATRLGDRGLGHLASLTRLRFLELSDTRVTDAGLIHLAGLASLRELELGGATITDAGLAHLSSLKKLRELGLANNRSVTDAGLVHLAHLAGLRELVLGNTGVTGAGLRHLAGLTSLELLELGGTRVGDRGLTHLSGLTRLLYLGLGATAVSGPGLVHLSGLTRLRELELWFTGVDDAAMASAGALPGLCELELSGTRVTDEGLVHLHKARGLRVLEFGQSKITPRGITRLRAALPALEASELASF